MRKNGRPEKFTKGILADIEKLAQVFCSDDKDIAAFLGVHPTTFCRWKQRHPEVQQSLLKGKRLAKVAITSALLQQARSGNMTAIIFALTNRFPEHWQDRRALVNNKIVNVNQHNGNGKLNGDDKAKQAELLTRLGRYFPA